MVTSICKIASPSQGASYYKHNGCLYGDAGVLQPSSASVTRRPGQCRPHPASPGTWAHNLKIVCSNPTPATKEATENIDVFWSFSFSQLAILTFGKLLANIVIRT